MKPVTWVTEIAALEHPPTNSIANWLSKPMVLSHALKRHCQQLSVEVIAQQFMPVDQTEQKLVESADTTPFVRRVLLQGDGQPWTYGRTVIAPSTYQAYFSQFIALGAKLLGETLLYGNPDTTRSRFEYAVVSDDTSLFHEIQQSLALAVPQLFARRSYFYLKQSPLLVTEVFLPKCPDYDSHE